MSASTVVTWHPLADGCAPEWASGWGHDAHGPFVDFNVKDAMQRLRWIPPGRFMMGSPDGEPGRFADRESPQHWVEITRGFWLFDTPCPQNLWEAVMGQNENPSRFKSPERPVEKVSWHDCQQFIERFNTLVPGLKLALPTEAEWEYACRAGTRDATYAGPIEILGESNAPVLDAIAWYGGNCGVEFDLEEGLSTSDWPEKQYAFDKGGTRIIATKDPNPWGLYDMLGNVLEWCRDGQPKYEDREEFDPVGPEGASADRVVRGGSWDYYARHVRAAFRGSLRPGGPELLHWLPLPSSVSSTHRGRRPSSRREGGAASVERRSRKAEPGGDSETTSGAGRELFLDETRAAMAGSRDDERSDAGANFWRCRSASHEGRRSSCRQPPGKPD